MSSAAVVGQASSRGLREVELSVTGMTCAACAARVQKKLGALDGVVAAVNVATERAVITAPQSVPVARLIEAVRQAGYGAELARPGNGASGADAPGGAGLDAARVAYPGGG
jgi:P-type Cu+ transporter